MTQVNGRPLGRAAKVAVSVLLAMIMVFSVMGTGLAAQAKSKQHIPVIYVHGLNGIKMYENIGTKDEKEWENLGLGSLTDILGKVLKDPTLVTDLFGTATGVHPDTQKFIAKVAKVVKGNDMNLDSNGKPKRDVGTHLYYTPSSEHNQLYDELLDQKFIITMQQKAGAENIYFYTYDWRLDLNEIGDGLDAYIDAIKKRTGAKKVDLIGESEGGAVLAAYLDRHGKDKEIDHLTFLNAAFAGVDVTALYNGDLTSDVDDAGLFLYRLGQAFEGGKFNEVIAIAAVLTNFLLRNVSDGWNNLNAEPAKKQLYDTVLKPLIGNIPVLYEFIPYEDFDEYMAHVVETGFLKKNSGVYKKVQAYHKTMGRLTQNLKNAEQNGIDVAVLANYGFPGLPLTSKSKGMTDLLIDTKYASAYATCADYGKTLKATKARTTGAKAKYFSPDKSIDASTCALPEDTWFVKNINHTLYNENTGAGDFVAALAVGEYCTNDLTCVKEATGYSQFLYADRLENLQNT